MSTMQRRLAAGELRHDLAALQGHWLWFVMLGIVLIILGSIALGSVVVATLATAMVIGALLVVGGIAEVVGAFWSRGWSGFFLYLLDGILRATVGTFLVVYPGAGALTLTLVLSFYFIAGGLFKSIGAMVLQFPSWGWTVASGVVSVALGVMLAMQWPASGLWFIGFAVGLDLILYGWALLMFAAAVKKLSPSFA